MVNEEIVGTDIDKDWILDAEGDLNLVRGSDNLTQAIYLRLNAYFGSLDWVYNNYGSYTKDWLGKNNTIYNRASLVTEIQNRIEKDPRIANCQVDIADWSSNAIGISVTARVKDGSTFQEYYIFSDLPRKQDSVNYPDYSNTWIQTREEGYYGKNGENVTVYCIVRDENNNIVPVGEVSISIGGYHVDMDDNPQMIPQSGSKLPGVCTFKFRLNNFIALGEHKLKFKYKGVYGYNDCTGETTLYVVKRIPTTMEFLYPKKNENFYYANDYDSLTDPIVHVADANDYDVEHGEVRYYLSSYGDDDELVFVEFPLLFHNSELVTENIFIYCKSTLLDYCLKFIFEIDYMFRPNDKFKLVSRDEELIDYLKCVYDDQSDSFYLVSTSYVFDYEGTGKDYLDDVDTQRYPNTNITMRVIE